MQPNVVFIITWIHNFFCLCSKEQVCFREYNTCACILSISARCPSYINTLQLYDKFYGLFDHLSDLEQQGFTGFQNAPSGPKIKLMHPQEQSQQPCHKSPSAFLSSLKTYLYMQRERERDNTQVPNSHTLWSVPVYQHTRELISTWKMSHRTETKSWITYSNSHLAC